MNTGIICEFNPFHKGHKYLIDTAGRNCDGVLCVMSGNLVQRGEFAVYDKFKRTRDALRNGANIVIELPCVYSTLSAEGFAKSAVAILEATGVADSITFGAECEDISVLYQLADRIKKNENEIKEEMKKGISYPAARKNIIKSDELDKPNNILAIEYIKHTTLPCTAVKRIGKGHDTDDCLYSASAIRNRLDSDEICSLKNCEKAVLAKLRTMSAQDFLEIEDVSDGLENRIYDAVKSASNLNELYDSIKTKRYTHSRIRRIMLRAYLGIDRNYPQNPPYIRILGFNQKGRELLTQMKKNASLPIISRYSDVKNLSDDGRRLFGLECRCTDLYNLGYKNPLPCGTEQRSQIVIL